MRNTVLLVLCTFIVIGLGAATCNAQTSANASASDEKKAIEVDVDGAMMEFRQLVCDAAIDIDSPLHRQSLAIVSRRQYTDSRFDDFIRSALQSDAIDDVDFTDRFGAAEILLSYSKVPEDERVRLLLDLLEQDNEALEAKLQGVGGSINAMRWQGSVVPVSRIAALLNHSNPALLAALKERISTKQPKTILVAATQLIKQDAADLLPALIEAAKSNHVPLQRVAIEAIDQLSIKVPYRSMLGLSAEETDSIAKLGIDEKIMKYAEKIIARYDTNGDKAIDAAEWKTMLIDPSPADINSDGFVTVMEYAAWMHQHSKR